MEEEKDDKVKIVSQEIANILKQHNCDLIVIKQNMYGQVVWVPAIVPLKDDK